MQHHHTDGEEVTTEAINAKPHMHEDYDYLSDVFTYHAPREGQIELFQALRNGGYELADLIRKVCPPSRESDIAIDTVRSAVMWANAALAIHGQAPEVVPSEIMHFFGDMTEDDARALKAAWQDGAFRRVESDANTATAPQTPEERPAMDVLTGGTFGEKPVAQETYLRDDERIGALQISEGRCKDCGADIAPTGNVVDNGNDLVCINCGRTGAYSLIEEPEQPSQITNVAGACPECGMIEPHVHIDDKTFLGDENGPEIQVLTGMGPLMEHFSIPGVPYVVLDETMDPGTFRMESGEESMTFTTDGPVEVEESIHVDPAKGVTAQGVADLVKSFLDRNPNALIEPIGGQMTDWINRGRNLIREQQSAIREEDV